MESSSSISHIRVQANRCRADMSSHSTKSSETDPSLKTRHFVDIIQEISTSMRIHKEQGTILGGVHLELTGEVNDDGFSVVSRMFLSN